MAYVDGVPVDALINEQVRDVKMEVEKDKVCQDQQTVHGKDVDLNGTVILEVLLQ